MSFSNYQSILKTSSTQDLKTNCEIEATWSKVKKGTLCRPISNLSFYLGTYILQHAPIEPFLCFSL